MRVGILGLMHESNTFLARPTTLADFRRETLLTGEAIQAKFAGGHHEVSGFFAGLSAEGIDAAPVFMAWATPGGAVAAEALDAMVAMMHAELDKAGKLDGLLVAPHGAGVSETHRDMDGHWLTSLRERVGPAVPILCTLDPHANVSPRMLAACDATIAYRSNPHLDQRQRGLEAAALMARTLRGEARPTQAGAFPGVAINIERQHTGSPPCQPLYALADRQRQQPGIVSNSVLLGFPYADVEEMGSGFIVVTDNDPALARRLADELAGYLVEHRREFRGQLVSIDDAVAAAGRLEGPVCLLDMGDNVGGGSPGDGTLLAHALRRRGGGKPAPDGRAFVCLYDPAAMREAARAGVGGSLSLSMGGKIDPLHGPPLEAAVRVRGLYEGKYVEKEARHSGLTHFDMGPTAVVDTDTGLTVMLTSRRAFPVSLGQLTSCGLDPKSFHILVAKGVHAPVAAYAPVCTRLIRVNTPGVTSADMSGFRYRHRRKPLYPFEEVGEGSANGEARSAK